jgi:hypothetical protein
VPQCGADDETADPAEAVDSHSHAHCVLPIDLTRTAYQREASDKGANCSLLRD